MLIISYLLFFSTMLFSQQPLSKVRANYAEDLFLLYNHSSTGKLDRIIKTYQSLGDKDIANKLILESLIYSNLNLSNENANEDFIPILLLSQKDSAYLTSLPQISDKLYLLPSLLSIYTLFAKSYLNESSFLYEYSSMMESKSVNFPNMPKFDDYRNIEIFFSWGTKYTNELSYFSELFKNLCNTWNGKECREGDFISFIDTVNNYFIENSFYKIWLPVYSYETEKSFNPIISFDLMYENPTGYINQLFDLVLERKPTDNELSSITKYITENTEITPELVLLSFLLKKHE